MLIKRGNLMTMKFKSKLKLKTVLKANNIKDKHMKVTEPHLLNYRIALFFNIINTENLKAIII